MNSKLQRKHMVEYSIAGMLILILLAVSIPRFQMAQTSNKLAMAKMRLANLDQAFKRFHADHGKYPQKFTMMTDPDLFIELISGGYITREEIKDPYIGPDETTNDGDPSSLFWDDFTMSGKDKFAWYNKNTNHYRGVLPGKMVYDLGSAGPDKVINMDNMGGLVLQEKSKQMMNLPREERAKWFNALNNKFEVFIDFDPSNGLISDGDIHVLGP